MRILTLLILLSLSVSSLAKSTKSLKAKAKTSQAKSQSHTRKKAATRNNPLGAKLGTEFDFNDMTVRGQYMTGFEGLATVEGDKGLDDLLDYRKELKDRVQSSVHFKVR
jgi:hypothetical protein